MVRIQAWDDLLEEDPENEPNDPFSFLSDDQLQDLAVYSRIQWLLTSGKAEDDGVAALEAQDLKQDLLAAGIDPEVLLAQRDAVVQQRIRSTNSRSVDDQPVRLPGVIIPLSQDGEGFLHDLLLLPHPLQCSHVPLPSPHQVVLALPSAPLDYADLISRLPTSAGGIPWVWAEGMIHFSVTMHQLFLVDGLMRIEASYALKSAALQICTAADLSERQRQTARQQASLLYPRLTDLIPADGRSFPR